MLANWIARRRQAHSRRNHLRRGRSFRSPLLLERLEDRNLLSTIVWVNRGDGMDQFDSTFGANDDLARSVVDAALDAWERLITDFQQAELVLLPFPHFENPNTIDITLSMNASGTGFGGGAGAPAEYDSIGHPLARAISIGRGNDTTGDGVGDGAGWYLDPTPNDYAEFAGPISNAFVGQATPGGAASGLVDLYSLVTIEMNHALGLTNFQDSGSPRWRTNNPYISNTGVADSIDTPGTLWTFSGGPSGVTALLTSNNGGPGGSDTGLPLHVALPPQGNAGIPAGFTGALDVGNASRTGFPSDLRYLPSLLSSLMLQDVYGYSLAAGGADVFGTMHSLLNTTNGNLLVRGMTGTNTSADIINISRSGGQLVVSVDVGADVAGTGPTGPLESRYGIGSVSSITINGLDGADTIKLSGDLSFLSGAITVTGDGGTDFLTVNFAAGNPVPAGGVNFDAGAGAGDGMILEGGSFPSEIYTATGSSSGNIAFGSSVITFSNLSPITDTVAVTNFTFNGTGSGEIVNMVNGPTVFTVDCGAGCQSTQINSGSGSFELINFAHKTNVTADGAGGGDTIVLDNPNLAEGLTSLTINGGSGIDTINIRRTIVALGVAVNGGSENDTINIGSSGNSLDTILGTVTVNGDTSTTGDTLNLNDQGDTDAHTYTVNSTTLSRNGAALITYGTIEQINVNGGSGGNIVDVRSTAFGTDVTVNSGSGSDTINIGSVGNSLDAILGSVSVNGQSPASGETLNINDHGDADGHTYSISATTVTRNGSANIDYATVESLILNAALGVNIVNVLGSLSTTPVTVNGGPNDDTVNVGNLANSLDDLQGTLTINGNAPAASDSVFVNDQGDADAHSYVITSTTVDRDGAAQITYATVELLTVNGGSGGNAINVQNTLSTTPVVVNAGSGDDDVFVDSDGGPVDPPSGTVDGIVSSVNVNGQGGTNTLRLEDYSDLGLVLGDIVHVTPTQIGADAGDSFFGTGGSLSYSDLSHITMNLSNGYFPDTVYLIPSLTTAFLLHGNDPHCPMNPDQLPGDALYVDFTGVTDPLLIADGEGHATWTFSNREDVEFDGFEKLNHVGVIVVAPDEGALGIVRIYNAETGALKFTITPYGKFTGGVRVAVGDVSCDGIPDIITAAGPGMAPLVRVFNGATGLPLPGTLGGFYAYPKGSQAGVWVAAGDINQDGFTDIITGPDNGGGAPVVKVFSGETGVHQTHFMAYDKRFSGGVRVATGDINGDSVPDIVVAPGPGRAPLVRVFNGANLTLAPFANFFAFNTNYRLGVHVAAGDVNGDGDIDIIAGGGNGNGARSVRVFDGTNLTGSPLFSFEPYASQDGDSIRVAVIDINGDGDVEVVTAGGPGGMNLPRVYDFTPGPDDVDGFFAVEPELPGGFYVGAGG